MSKQLIGVFFALLASQCALLAQPAETGADAPTPPEPALTEGREPSPPDPNQRQRLPVTELLLFGEEELVITPARHQQSSAFSPSIVSVITAEDIESSGFNNIADLFRSVPGMDVLCSYDTQTDVVPRGLITYQSAKVLVLVNGHRVNNDYLGSVLWKQLPVSLSDIRRIEVVRGPGSALYGANALAGMINIITKRPSLRSSVAAQARYGTFTTREAYISQAGAQGGIGYSISGGYYQSGGWGDVAEIDTVDGYQILGYSTRNLSGVEVKIKDWSKMEKLFLTVDGKLPQGVSMEFESGFARGAIAVPEFSNIYYLSKANQFNSNASMRLWRDGLAADDRLRLSFDHVITDIDSGFMASKTRRVGAELQYDVRMPYQNMVITGLGWEEVSGKGPAVGGLKRMDRLFAAFVQDEYTPDLLAGCNLTAGLRYDRHSDQDAVVSPRAALSLSPLAGYVLRAAAGSAFRKPNFMENYYYADLSYRRSGVTYNRIGRGLMTLEGDVYDAGTGELVLAKDPRPERAATYEFGYEIKPLPFLTTEVTLFRSKVEGLIMYQQYDSVRVGTVVYDEITVYANLMDAVNKGVEAEVRVRPLPWVQAYGNFTYQEVWDVTDPDSTFRLYEASRRKANLGLRANRWGLTGDVAIHCVIDRTQTTSPAYLTKVPLGPYNTIDVNLGYRRALGGVRWTASVAALNLFDKKHNEFPVFGSATYVLDTSPSVDQREIYLNRNALNERKIIGTLGLSF